jgi:DsbC/DsbD-like thiol-disulfide interchange protein
MPHRKEILQDPTCKCEFTMLFEQIIDDDWHTYWRNPGDSGAPPSVNWFTQKGVTVSDFSWPSPERIAYGPLMNYGYHHAVSLPVTVSVSDDFVGDTIEITVVGRVLVCADLCIPEKVSLSLSIPVGQFVLDESTIYPGQGEAADNGRCDCRLHF